MALAKDKMVNEKLVTAIAPSIYGYERVKEALLLQLMGGVQKRRSDGIVSRGDIHVLLVGDPGSGKSQLLKRISVIAPKGRYVSGGGVSGAGITAAVVKDEILGGWSLEAGALVLANNGICAIDEMDKMSEEDSGAMHEALEQQSVSIAKASIQATLIARTTVLAAANPKYGRFDQYGNIAEQINMPPTLINRFDLIFTIKDLPQLERDEKTAKHILQLHQTPEIQEPEISTELLKKYISYARQKIKPVLTDEAIDEIKEFYVQLRNREVSDERAARAIPISPRQLEALVRMSEASARIRLSEKVTREDARRAIELLVFCLMQIGREKETGQIDIDRIATGIPASQREKIFVIKQILEELEQELGKTIPVEDVARIATEKGLSKSEVDEIIEK
ncbi:MAG: minichromosome maintenance protein MCM, partial [Nanoarchaeota archaeon]